ncbi:MAG: cytochrome c oxidase subunit II, partial [Cyanobacteria bacterium J06623_1]
MTGGDVIHAFWLPEFRIKQDVIPGRETNLVFTPNKIGQYPVVCAELCGAYHGGMKTQLYVQSQEDYQKWIQENTFAMTENNQSVAMNPASNSDAEFLAPYAQEMGIDESILAQLKP